MNGDEGVIQYIEYAASQANAQGKPFFMVLSLINPHDVLFQPAQFVASGYDPSFLVSNPNISFPSTMHEDLSTKPACQEEFLRIGQLAGATPITPDDRQGYL